MKEIWHPCAGYETHYEVSNFGNVRSIERYANNAHNNGLRKIKSTLLKPALGKSGYMLVSLCVDNVKSSHNVHRLVARAFIENELNKPQVNHKDGNKLNNSFENLEWVTASENGLHSYRVLGNVAKNKPAFGVTNPKVKPVIATNLDTGKQIFLAGTKQKKELGFTQTCVDKAIRDGKSYKGWIFQQALVDTQASTITTLTDRITALEAK
jgi:hypothetical protein